MILRRNVNSGQELVSFAVADGVLIIAFSLAKANGLISFSLARFLFWLPIATVGISLSFVLHELMHKLAAKHYGAIASFMTSPNGLLMTLAAGAFGIFFGIPGATMIYASGFTSRENALVSLAGPLTNFAVFGACLAILIFTGGFGNLFIQSLLAFTIFISILLAFFNMLPIPPLDGSKVIVSQRASQ